MTFTELECVLILACAVLAWRVTTLQRELDEATEEAEYYSNAIAAIGDGRARVVKRDEHSYEIKETNL